MRGRFLWGLVLFVASCSGSTEGELFVSPVLDAGQDSSLSADSSVGGTGGTAGSGASGATGGTAGTGGVAGQGGIGGTGGMAGLGGTAGTGGTAGQGGAGGIAGSGGTAGTGGTAGQGGAGGIAGTGGTAGISVSLLGPLHYRSFSDSPFATAKPKAYFYLEDFEDDLLNAPGATETKGVISSSFGVPKLIDSVDGDDGIPNSNSCVGCNSWFSMSGPGGLEFVFDPAALGSLPTHVGVVFTDAGLGANVLFTAFDANGVVLGTVGPAQADNTNEESCPEDRFFGIVASVGVKRILLTASSGGIEADHLQYGRE